MQHTNTWNTVKSWIVYALVFLFPLFFLPITQEFYTTNKLYLLAFGAIVLLIISVVEFAMNKKITWSRKPFDTNVLLIVAAVGLTTIITTPNKVGSLVNPYLGLVAVLALGIFYLFLTHAHRSRKEVSHEMELGQLNYFTVLTVSSVILAVISVITFFNPFRSIPLPGILGFLSNPTFTPMGMPLDLGIFLGFMAIAHIVYIITRNETAEQKSFTQSMWLSVGSVCIILIALIFTLFSILKPGTAANPVNLMPPFRISWYAAVEILKNPLTALFGGGIGNFSSVFASVKDAAYNVSPLWQVQSFNASRSTILHIFTETGLFGLIAFGLLIFQAVRILKAVKNPMYKVLFAYIMLVLLLLPPSLPVMFLLVVLLAVMPQEPAPVAAEGSVVPELPAHSTLNMAHIIPLYAGILVLAVALLGSATYLLGRSYASEYFFKQALDGIGNNNAQQLYTSQRQAILLNPYIERFRISFSQTNLLLANNFAIAATAPEQEGGQPRQLTESDRNNIAQAIQAAIQEAKAAVTLNPQNPGNWENLANIYRNILNVAQGADAWTVASYQEAMGRDPRNPSLFLNLGGVFYSIGNYDDAIRMFEQAVVLKPDWSNAYYNLAWSAAQKGDYARAAGTMEQVIRLINPSTEEADYKKATADLQDFRSKMPQAQQPQGQQESAAGVQPQELALPTPPVATVEPKLDLPENAEPPTSTTGREATGSAVQGESTQRQSPTPSVATGSAGGP